MKDDSKSLSCCIQKIDNQQPASHYKKRVGSTTRAVYKYISPVRTQVSSKSGVPKLYRNIWHGKDIVSPPYDK